MSQSSAVIFGAGAVGRGFIGEIFNEAGLEVVFIDVDQALLDELARDGSYTHITVDKGTRDSKTIAPVKAIHSENEQAVGIAISHAEIAATCVGPRALPAVCRTIARAVRLRVNQGRPPLNLLLAENLHDAPRKVREWLKAADPAMTDAFIDQHLALISTSIGRMIPVADQSRSHQKITTIEVEPYRFLPLDVTAAKGQLVDAKAFVIAPDIPFEYYSDRKLYVHNMGHAMCAYLGACCGDTYIWQAIGRIEVRFFVRAAMIESATAVAARYGQPMGPLLDHIDDLLHRLANEALADTVARVGRDPRRKLSPEDRFLGAVQLCRQESIPSRFILTGLAAALNYMEMNEPGSSVTMREVFYKSDLLSEQEREQVFAQLEAFQGGFDCEQQLRIVDQPFKRSWVA
ncbi:mannitol-1-phosphate 5-dehydrogenase [Actinomycetaceae bacterium WB03_NA08]|uniref:Mannitol-1-phosphate 5-dehydrogenase n=1 Tax=Scrofimicrobium canadense TaxID=2652290 RepID=A0A6N7W8P4_9ACTO|nr:mannitol-1-phosphate 5-dehydrogenase [Scrofimicrobium canadense]MSS84646.1 mannitol-1-phosphate 5-dehydrogenase [Scrofimicrobium canadense]